MALTSDFNPSAPNVTYQRMRQLLAESGGGLQAGVIGATDLKVAQRGAGANMSVDVPAGAAWVAITTGTRNGLAHVYNDATANVAVTASNATNPRIDSIILRYNDTTVPTGSGSTPTLEVATGTATAGATLDNRTGAATPTGDFLRLADILVPAASTSVTTANIRDRRPWARGAYVRILRNASNLTTASTSYTDVDATNIKPRIECSGVPLRITLRCETSHSVSLGLYVIVPSFDALVLPDNVAAGGDPFIMVGHATAGQPSPSQPISWDTIPSAGSHLVGPAWRTITAGTVTMFTTATIPLVFTVEEIVRPSASNT